MRNQKIVQYFVTIRRKKNLFDYLPHKLTMHHFHIWNLPLTSSDPLIVSCTVSLKFEECFI